MPFDCMISRFFSKIRATSAFDMQMAFLKSAQGRGRKQHAFVTGHHKETRRWDIARAGVSDVGPKMPAHRDQA